MEMQVEEGWGRVGATCFSPLALRCVGPGALDRGVIG